MHKTILQCLLLAMSSLLLSTPSVASANNKVMKQLQMDSQADLKGFPVLWKSYQDTLSAIEKSLPLLRQEKDAQKRQNLLATHHQKLQQSKNTISKLILPQNSSAYTLRQQIIEHATKYQNVLKLAAIENPTSNQNYAFDRLNQQTEQLHQKMLQTSQNI